MKRTIITMDGNGTLSIPSNLENLWMSEGELVNIFHAPAPKLNSVIRAIYKEGMLSMSEVQRKDETSVGVWQTLYSFPMIVVICYFGCSLSYWLVDVLIHCRIEMQL